MKIIRFNDEIENDVWKRRDIGHFLDSEIEIQKLLRQSDRIEKNAKEFRKTKDFLAMAEIFERVSALTGLPGTKQELKKLVESYEKRGANLESLDQLKLLLSTQLDFAIYHSRLKDGRHTVEKLKEFFDEIFGHVQKSSSQTVVIQSSFSPLMIVGLCMGTVFLIVIGSLMIYGCTANGRAKYQNLYLYYFGKQADFETRWRYASFADEQDGKNTMLDAVREVNKTNLIAALKRGAYINAYNNFGNTALHAATKGLHPEQKVSAAASTFWVHVNFENSPFRETFFTTYSICFNIKITFSTRHLSAELAPQLLIILWAVQSLISMGFLVYWQIYGH